MTGFRRRRSAVVPAAALLVVFVCTSLATAAPGAASRRCAGVTSRDGWKKIATPVAARAFTVHPRAGIVVAGDDVVMSSRDGGCTWRTDLELRGAPLPDERFVALTSAGGVLVAATTGPHVMVSRDGGATWDDGDDGLDLPGEPTGLHATSSGDVYLLVRQAVSDAGLATAGVPEQGVAVLATVLYRSADGGSTWERRGDLHTAFTGPRGSDVEGGGSPGAVWDLAIDPLDPNHLLAASKGGVFRSTNGGADWRPAAFSPMAEARTVSIARPAGLPASAVAVDPRSGTLLVSGDVAAGRWTAASYPQLQTERMATYPNASAWAWSALGPDGRDVVLAGPKGVFRWQPTGLADVTPSLMTAAPAEVGLFPGAAGPSLWARSFDGSALFVQAPRFAAGSEPPAAGGGASVIAPPGAGAGGPPGLSVPDVDSGDVRLDPGHSRVELDPGASRTVRYVARIEPRPAPVDLYFLVDTTASMTGTLRSLTRGMGEIVQGLAAAGIRLRAGVGAFRSYPRGGDGESVDYAYRRVRGLGAVDEDLVTSLYELEGGGSSGANLAALHQAVTGEGQDVFPPGPSRADVAPGLEAGFRHGATKVVVHFADTWFGTPERGDPNGHYAPGTWPGPSFEEVTSELRAASVRHLGVAMQPSGGGTLLANADVVEDLRLLSRASSSLAGSRGADCDGDGHADVTGGEPLVCLLDRDASAHGLASVVVGLVRALEDPRPVALVEPEPSGYVSGISPAVHPRVDLTASHDLAFEVTVTCPRTAAGKSRRVGLALQVAGEQAAAAELLVACRAAPPQAPSVEKPEPRVPLIPPIPVPPPPPHSAPGPGPGSVTAPAPVQAPAPAQAPGGQPQGVLAAQRQQEPQLAFVAAAQQVRAQANMQHAMVRTTARDPLTAAKAWTAAGALSLLWAWGLATAAAPSLVRSSRRPR